MSKKRKEKITDKRYLEGAPKLSKKRGLVATVLMIPAIAFALVGILLGFALCLTVIFLPIGVFMMMGAVTFPGMVMAWYMAPKQVYAAERKRLAEDAMIRLNESLIANQLPKVENL